MAAALRILAASLAAFLMLASSGAGRTEPTQRLRDTSSSRLSGHILQVRLSELRPTQGAVGHDQIHAILGRWQGGPMPAVWQHESEYLRRYLRETLRKKFDDYCTTNGQGGLATGALEDLDTLYAARIDTPTSFTCTDAPGTHAAALKTVIIGPGNVLYLTDGHHTFTSFYETRDGGPDVAVHVWIDADYSHLDDATFWARMVAECKAWLRDGHNVPIAPNRLPTRLGLATPEQPDGLQDDPYRSLVYFARRIGYDNEGLPEFAEFMWADWLRPRLDLSRYRTSPPAAPDTILAPADLSKRHLAPEGSHDSYAAAVRDAALLMSAQPDDAPVAAGYTAAKLGRIHLQPDAPTDSPTSRARRNLTELTRNNTRPDDTPRTAGRLWYAVMYQPVSQPTPQQP
ncbi:chromosome partitioning protein ParB [Alcaligenaceae bacterium SJ-26]|nr:chromosome partitioning protein ParB [Alcaligenaceae bacterium SJ-26]